MTPDRLDALLLIGFGILWPLGVYRMRRSERTFRKSLIFLAVFLIGYICGVFF